METPSGWGLERVVRIFLILAALITGLNLMIGTVGWNRIWSGLDNTQFSITDVRPADDYSQIDVRIEFTNRSSETLILEEAETWLRLDGRAISSGSLRFDDTAVPPDSSRTIEISNAVQSVERSYVEERTGREQPRWVAGGRFKIGIDTLTEPVWYPFAIEVER